jgi:glucose-6-phosphate isomerase
LIQESLRMSDTAALDRAWSAFDAAADRAADERIADMLANDAERLSRLTVEAAGLTVDLSKQAWTREGEDACLALAEAAGVAEARAAMFAGTAVNTSEDRAVLHAALRAPAGAAFAAKGEAVSGAVEAGRAKMKALADAVQSGAAKGSTGKPFRSLVHIGIGGSDLGPRLVWEALRPLQPKMELRFAANVDPAEIAAALAGLDPAETLVVVVSKTFTTQETLANAEAARAWLRAALGDGADAHFAAVSAAPDRAAAFGISSDRVFAFWDWVGGRYSVWSAVGLSCAIGLGWEAFERFLAGAAAMDEHFLNAPLARNAPVLMALAQIWNRNGLGRGMRAVVPYARRLTLLPAFLQQLEMESNGKRVDKDGQVMKRATAPAVFGDAGTNGQHAFFQLLHQGTDIIPVDFVAVAQAGDGPPELQKKLLANCLAQAEALMVGKQGPDVPAERTFTGSRPSTLIVMQRLTPETLGALIALYEHKTFVEGIVWGINSFDQWGVELGKVLAGRILGELEGGAALEHDPSTAAWVKRLS